MTSPIPPENDLTTAELKIAALSEFAHGISHDLKAPLRHIETYAGMLRDMYASQIDANGQKFITRVTVNAARAQRLIESLLRYAEATEPKTNSGLAALPDIVASVIDAFAEEIEAAGAEVSVAPLPQISVPAQDTETLLDILLQNSLTYRSADAPKITIHAEEAGDALRISVTDNGLGVAEEFRKRIFQPFKRLHSRDEIEGSGLGLATARHILARHGGTIDMMPNTPQGSVFFFTLPKS